MKRSERANMAMETLAILHRGAYVAPSGATIDIAHALRESVEATQLIRPRDWPRILNEAQSIAAGTLASIEVTVETSIAAAHRLAVDENRSDVAVLNFASAKNPGGGFLGGSQAQEESLARSSGLYATLQAAPDYYEVNRKSATTVYTDHAILSPRVPVFRDDQGLLLEQPFSTTFITMPAVNVGALRVGSTQQDRVEEIMRCRIEYVLALAAATEHRALVLGAWGCGVFRNDPEMIAALFADLLNREAPWRKRFERIVFAVFSPGSNVSNLTPFERHFGAAR